MLSIKNLHASVEEKNIIKGLNLEVKPGEVHAIMGPNGAGKSTLGYVLSGRDGYEVSEGEATLNGKDLLELDVEERAREGLFLAFQYPVEIPGVSNMEFMKESVNAMREERGEAPLTAAEFLKKAKDALKNDPFIKNHPQWQKALNMMLEMGVRIEQQAFAKHGLNYVINTYLPKKLSKPASFLP